MDAKCVNTFDMTYGIVLLDIYILGPSDAYMHHWTEPSLALILPEPMFTYRHSNSSEQTSVIF